MRKGTPPDGSAYELRVGEAEDGEAGWEEAPPKDVGRLLGAMALASKIISARDAVTQRHVVRCQKMTAGR